MTALLPDVPKIEYGGPRSKNPLEFKWYNTDEIIGEWTMKEHLRFSVVSWHTFCNTLIDPFSSDGRLADFVKARYHSWDAEPGRRVEGDLSSFADLEANILPKGDAAKNVSGRQEMLENLINEFI